MAKPDKKANIEIETLEDSSAVQLTVTRVLTALGSGRIDARRAGTLLYGLQIAANITARNRSLADADAVQDVSFTEDGQPLAAESITCEPIDDCDHCPTPHECLDCKLLNMLQKGPIAQKGADQ